jgi:carboxyl-terminal processing protease
MKKRFLAVSLAILVSVVLGTPLAVPAAGPDRDQVTKDFIEALTVIEGNYAGEIDYPRVSKTAIYGMLRTLDPHSSFYDREEFETFRTEQQSQYFGIGASIGARNGKVFILAPFPDTPALRAGLRYGDEIVEVDGKSTKGWSSFEVSSNIKGPRGTKVTIKYQRPGIAELQTAEIIRDMVPQPSVTNAYMVAPGIGYIHLQRGFNSTSSDEVKEALAKLEPQGLKSLILDLRDNPGGFVKEAIAISSDFLYKGQGILSIRGRSGGMRSGEIPAMNPTPNEAPLVVLVNGASASASEIVAGALQDHDRALIVGQTSFGKGLVQSPFELEKDSGGLILTTGKYYTPSGRLIQRDYSKTSFYDYIMHRSPMTEPDTAKKEVFRTDSGRPIYGGGGISPDIDVAFPPDTNKKLAKWIGATFAFTAQAVNGQVRGFESFRLESLKGGHLLQSGEFIVTDKYIDAFKKFVAETPSLKLTAAEVEAEREYLRSELRRELVTAHYGTETAAQVTNLVDPQLQRAIREVPQAERMAQAYRRNKPNGAVVSTATR